MLDAVSYVWLYVRDLEKSIQFYNEILGMPVSGKWHEGALLNAGNLFIGVHIEEGAVTRGNSPVVTFRVTDHIEKVCEILKTRGAQFIGDISVEPYGKIASLKDPDGHSLLLHEPSPSVKSETT